MVDDVTESLPQLIKRRQRELGDTSGDASLAQLYRRLPDGDDRITYETLRNLANGKQRGARGSRVPRDLAIILGVPESDIRESMGVPASHGPWELPQQAEMLDPEERGVVLGVVNALIRAKSGAVGSKGGQLDDQQSEAEKITKREQGGASLTSLANPYLQDQAAQSGRQSRAEFDDDHESEHP